MSLKFAPRLRTSLALAFMLLVAPAADARKPMSGKEMMRLLLNPTANIRKSREYVGLIKNEGIEDKVKAREGATPVSPAEIPDPEIGRDGRVDPYTVAVASKRRPPRRASPATVVGDPDICNMNGQCLYKAGDAVVQCAPNGTIESTIYAAADPSTDLVTWMVRHTFDGNVWTVWRNAGRDRTRVVCGEAWPDGLALSGAEVDRLLSRFESQRGLETVLVMNGRIVLGPTLAEYAEMLDTGGSDAMKGEADPEGVNRFLAEYLWRLNAFSNRPSTPELKAPQDLRDARYALLSRAIGLTGANAR